MIHRTTYTSTPAMDRDRFDSPSEQSITAVLSPDARDKDYLYFVANLKTGEVLYATTREQHDANTAKFASDNAAADK